MIKENWSKYYTPISVANEILSKLPLFYKPEVAIDICAGSGNFLKVARKRWKDVKLVGIDINTENLDILNHNSHKLQFDALNVELLKKELKPFLDRKKIILANPPFGRYKCEISSCDSSKDFPELISEALKFDRIELLMLVSNISILNDGDFFGAVIPENFFTSHNLKKFRDLFISYFVDVNISKTSQCFDKSEVKTRYFLGQFNKSNFKINFEETYSNFKIKLDFNLIRGIDNSKLLSSKKCSSSKGNFIDVLHFNNIDGEILKKKYVRKEQKYERLKVKETDLLILRVGRNSGSVFKVIEDYRDKYISDYFYLLKGCDFDDEQVQNLEAKLKAKVNGLTVNYLTKLDLTSTIINLRNKSC